MARHVIVTGGAGFIGSNFIRFLRRERPDWRVTNVDALTYSGNLENLAGLEGDDHCTFVKLDVNDRDALRERIAEADAVVHMAAESHVDRSIMDPKPFVDANVLGTQSVLQAAREAWGDRAKHDADKPLGTHRVVYVSTDEVYGDLPLDRPDLKFHEGLPLVPRSPYAASKAAGDLMAQAYHHTFGADVVITRCSNNFGPYQFPEKIIPLFVTNLIDGEPVPLYGDGMNVRDWLHVEDHCEAVLTVLERGRHGEAYNIGGDNERSNLELTMSILGAMGRGDECIRYVRDRPGHDRRYAIDARKIETELGWRPSRSAWPDALEATVRWYVENETWWRNVKTGAYRDYYAKQYT